MAIVRSAANETSSGEGSLAQVERVLARAGHTNAVRLVGENGEEAVLPEAVARALRDIVSALARDPDATFTPVTKLLTTQQAAELLNVSRPFLVEHLLASGEIPYVMTGAHRRIAREDLLAYKRRRDEQRRRQLDELAAMSQEMGLDHD